MLPYNQKIAFYQYPELDFEWPVLAQQEDKTSGQIVRREFSLFDFDPEIDAELLTSLLEENENPKLTFKIKKRITKTILTSQYTWTLNNSKDKDGNLLDFRWDYNRFIGWEKRVFIMLHTGRYTSEVIGEVKWGLTPDESDEIITEIPSDFLRVSIFDQPNAIIFSKTPLNKSSGIVVVDLGSDADIINIKSLSDNAKVYWVSPEETEYETLRDNLLIRKTGIHVLVSRYIKLVLPEPKRNVGNDDSISYVLNEVINIDVLDVQIEATTDLKTLEVRPVTWEVRTTPVDYENPLPVTPITIPINLEIFN